MSEKASAHLLHRRQEDPPEADYRGRRYYEEREVIVKRPDTYTRWIVGTVGAGILALLGTLAMRDRQSIDQVLVHQEGRIKLQEQTTARHVADLAVLKSSGVRMERDLAELKETIKAVDEKLDRVLMEVRRANR